MIFNNNQYIHNIVCLKCCIAINIELYNEIKPCEINSDCIYIHIYIYIYIYIFYF